MVSKDVTSCKFLDGKQPDSTLQVWLRRVWWLKIKSKSPTLGSIETCKPAICVWLHVSPKGTQTDYTRMFDIGTVQYWNHPQTDQPKTDHVKPLKAWSHTWSNRILNQPLYVWYPQPFHFSSGPFPRFHRRVQEPPRPNLEESCGPLFLLRTLLLHLALGYVRQGSFST